MPWYIHPVEVLESPLRERASLPCAKQQVPILAVFIEEGGVATGETRERPGVCFTAHRDTEDAGAALQ